MQTVQSKWKQIVRITVLLLLSLILVACSKEDEIKEVIDLVEPISVNYITVPASVGDVSNVAIFDAYVIPYTEELSFERNGEFVTYHVKIGDYVKKGDLLAELDDEPLIEQVTNAREKIAALEKKYEGNKIRMANDIQAKELSIEEAKKKIATIDNEDAGSENELKKLKADMIAKEADIIILEEKIKNNNELLGLELSKLTDEFDEVQKLTNHNQIYAPFDGNIISLAGLSTGDRVTAERLIIGIVKPEETRITCAYISEISISSSVEYYLFLDGKKYPITYLPYDPQEYASILLKGETPISTFLYEGNDSNVNQGDYGLICLVKDKIEDALTVPVDALHKDSTGDYVYVIEDGKKLKRNVITGLSDITSVEILDGLKEGEDIHVEN